ncbi:MAG: hypothetical protein AAFP69_04360 [Planctomycetota bacterium]
MAFTTSNLDAGDKKRTANDTGSVSIDQQVKSLASGLSQLPPNPKPGECYVRVRVLAKYKTVTEDVMIRQATVRYQLVPAKFREVEERVMTNPESVRYEIIPAEYRTDRVTVVCKPEHTKLTSNATEFRDQPVNVQTEPERIVWKTGENPMGDISKMAGDILCLVVEPAKFRKVMTRVVDHTASIKKRSVAAETMEIDTQVMVRPSRVKEIPVPASYKTVRVQKMVSPAKMKEIPVPAEYEKIETRVLVSPAKMVWRRVLCETNVTPDLIHRLRAKLQAKGFDNNQSCDKWSDELQRVVRRYQKKNELSQGGLTYEFLEHLGVDAR